MCNVLITGANRGLGAMLSEAYAKQGFSLVLHSRKPFVPPSCILESVKEVVLGDLVSTSTLDRLTEVAEQFDVNVLVNNAAVYDGTSFGQMLNCTVRHLLEVNLVAPILLTKALWPILVKNRGLVVNINSLAGLNGGKNETAYCASKHGLAGFGKALQFDGTKDGVKVLTVYIGAMKTEMSHGRAGWNDFIEPSEAADFIVDLCRDYSSLRVTEVTLARGKY